MDGRMENGTHMPTQTVFKSKNNDDQATLAKAVAQHKPGEFVDEPVWKCVEATAAAGPWSSNRTPPIRWPSRDGNTVQ